MYFRYKEKLSEERTKLSQDIVLQKEKELKSCQDQLKQCHTEYVVTTLQLCYRHMGYVTLKCTSYSTVYTHCSRDHKGLCFPSCYKISPKNQPHFSFWAVLVRHSQSLMWVIRETSFPTTFCEILFFHSTKLFTN